MHSQILRQRTPPIKRRRKLRKKAQLILFLSLLTLPLIWSESKQSRTVSGNEFGIDLTRTYTGSEVAELLGIMAEEADKAIESAYQEGYKAAVLEYSPENERLRSLAESIKLNLKEERKKISLPMWLVPIAAGVSFVSGWLLKAAF